MRASLLLILLAAPAGATCQGDTVFSCRIGAKILEVCHAAGALTYAFGPEGQPELTLSRPLATAAFTPWPGIGSEIWETVAFPSRDHVYEVWTSVLRDPESTAGLRGGVDVLRGEELVARLRCDPGTPSQSLDVIYDLKTAIGQCWDFDAKAWTRSCG